MGIKIIYNNKKAYHEYIISEKLEAGVCLLGTEVKSCRAGKVNLSDGWVDVDKDLEPWLVDSYIGKYTHGNVHNHEEKRRRKLLLNRKEIIKLTQRMYEKGLTVVPLKMYFKGQHIKVEIGLGKGKKLHDKRQASKEKDANREIARAMKG